mmetsp:Transcript_26906/g.42045  ORF Transcript_26906/g.42045 Transcript_26906/m.42045 type:complete len:155 (+) Transcript_26906:1742-2206(+)
MLMIAFRVKAFVMNEEKSVQEVASLDDSIALTLLLKSSDTDEAVPPVVVSAFSPAGSDAACSSTVGSAAAFEAPLDWDFFFLRRSMLGLLLLDRLLCRRCRSRDLLLLLLDLFLSRDRLLFELLWRLPDMLLDLLLLGLRLLRLFRSLEVERLL